MWWFWSAGHGNGHTIANVVGNRVGHRGGSGEESMEAEHGMGLGLPSV